MSVDQPLGATPAPRAKRRPEGKLAVFAARPGGAAERFAEALGSRHPALVFVVALLGGFLLLAVVSILLGLLVVHVLVSGSGLGLAGADESFIETLADHRSGTLTTISEVGSQVGGAPVLPILVGIIGCYFAFTRRWLLAAFAVFVLLAESATYRVTSIVVPRDRPSVHRLEDLPVDASYPSGHTAASVAVYSGLVLLLTAGFTSSVEGAGLDLRDPADHVRRVLAPVPRHAPSARRRRRRARRHRSDPAVVVRLSRRRRGRGEALARMKLAVVAHAGKTLGGGLPELRRTLADAGISSPLWIEVPKSKRAPGAVERALEDGAELILAWGGDGMVRRCVNALGNTQVPLAIVPAGTSNLFATNLGIERDIAEAVETALLGDRRRLDVGRFNGERFAVMAGAGFDAAMIKGADDLKDRLGRAAYVLAGAANLNAASFEAKIKVDGTRWYKGPASCILVGNVGDLFGGIEVFADAQPDDGLLDVGVLTSDGPVQLAARGRPHRPRQRREVAIRPRHPGALGAREARPQGPLRARRWRPQEGQVVQGRRRSRRDHGLRPARGPGRRRIR